MRLSSDPKSRNARVWSNCELKKFSPLFSGQVCNVSGWKDIDKEGALYKNYFSNAQSYTITNYEDEFARGKTGTENEIVLDLTAELPPTLQNKFDVVFNHTTLEHIFEFDTAFTNLCKLSKDIVIVVVPFLQETHGDYGDYWRFTPQSIDKLFKKNKLETVYISCNDQARDSMYVFAIGSKNAAKWTEIVESNTNMLPKIYTHQFGTKIIADTILMRIRKKINPLVRAIIPKRNT